MERRRLYLVVLAALFFSPSTWAGISTSGDIDPVYPGGDPWDVGGDLTVGWDAVATLTVNGGSDVSSTHAYIGYDYTGDGTVLFSGAGSRWDITGELQVAGAGLGTLTIEDGAWVVSDDVLIAIDDNGWGDGQIAVTGSDSLLFATDELQVGYTGVGVLLVEQGGEANSAFGAIGAYPGSSGIAQVIDSGSLWTNTGVLYVGGDNFGAGGSGILDVSDGGVVSTDDLQIWSSGRLEGNGQVSANRVFNDGTVAPAGTLALSAHYVQGPSSYLEIDIDNSGAADRVQVSGPVTLEGGTVVASSGQTITQPWTYTIVSGTSVTGTFSGLDRSQVAILLTNPGIPDLRLGYAPTSVSLEVVLLPFNDASIVQTPNQRALGDALQGLAGRGGNNITTALGQLNGLAAVRSAYDALSGQNRLALTSVTQSVTEGFQSGIGQRLQEQTEPEAYAQRPQPRMWGYTQARSADVSGSRVWGQVYGMGGRLSEEAEGPGYNWSGGGGLVGLDHWWTDHLLVGLAGGGAFSRVHHNPGDDRSDIESMHIGGYSRWNLGQFRVDGLVQYGDLNYSTRREITVTNERVDGRFGGRTWSASLEGSWLWREALGWGLEPLVGLQQTEIEVDGYQESGGTAALAYGAQDWTSLRGWLGLRAACDLADVGVGPVRLLSHCRWIHEFSDAPPPVAVHFVQDAQTAFTVTDRSIGRDSLQVGLGVQIEVSSQTKAVIHYDGLLNADITRHVVGGGVVYRW